MNVEIIMILIKFVLNIVRSFFSSIQTVGL